MSALRRLAPRVRGRRAVARRDGGGARPSRDVRGLRGRVRTDPRYLTTAESEAHALSGAGRSESANSRQPGRGGSGGDRAGGAALRLLDDGAVAGGGGRGARRGGR